MPSAPPFNDILHGDLERLEFILDIYTLDDQELRAALQNVVRKVIELKKTVEGLRQREGLF